MVALLQRRLDQPAASPSRAARRPRSPSFSASLAVRESPAASVGSSLSTSIAFTASQGPARDIAAGLLDGSFQPWRKVRPLRLRPGTNRPRSSYWLLPSCPFSTARGRPPRSRSRTARFSRPGPAGPPCVGELVFNTSMTGYQEILTDPSYAGQIVTFTFPHIGNVGTNDEDIEALTPLCTRHGAARAPITEPSNWRSSQHLDALARQRRASPRIGGVDTRRITRILRERGAQNAALAYRARTGPDLEARQGPRARPRPASRAWTLRSRSPAASATSWRGPLGLARGLCSRRRAAARTSWPSTTASSATSCASLASLGLPGDAWCRRPRTADGGAGAGAGRRSSCPTAPATRRRPATTPCPRSGSWSTAASRCSASASAIRCWAGPRRPRPRRCRSATTAPTTRCKDLTTGKVEITSQNHGFAIADAEPAGRGRGHPPLAVRRHDPGHPAEGPPGVLGPVPSRGVARTHGSAAICSIVPAFAAKPSP